jgi:sodium transport system permease protein
MNWTNVKLIFHRETRDQLRDRRTLFTVVVMPLILYPLMGMAMLQVAQFMREYPTKIWVVGSENLPSAPNLISDGKFDGQWCDDDGSALLELQFSQENDQRFNTLIEQFKESPKLQHGAELVDQLMELEMKSQGVDLAIIIPKTIDKYIDVERGPPGESDGAATTNKLPRIYIFHNSAHDKSKIAAQRVAQILSRWKTSYVKQSLDQHNIPTTLVQGVRISSADVANKVGRQAATWSKILPFIVIIWSLTGAFYPAIDLCAGEKERGTFETLLSSPTGRNEIAIGKLLTVMSFSIATALLNLMSMGFTGMFVMSRLGSGISPELAGGMGAPAFSAIIWLVIALIPISALFSAVALAAAAFARSSKEGQYYLVPLLMISMPLMMIPMLPAARLDLGTSLIPVSGLMLLLRGLIEGEYAEVIRYVGPVCAVTLVCCYVAIRWVVYQFNSESVLFRASERFGVGAWFQHVMRERHELPSMGSAVMLGVTILVLKFFIGFAIQAPNNWFEFTKQVIVVLVASIGVPTALMALIMTRSPRKTLRLRWCSFPVACAAVLTAICLHPMIMWFSGLVMYIYPPAGDLVFMESMMTKILGSAPGLWAIILVFAIAPAIVEEFAFRGFILSGFETLKNRWQAVLITSLLFGLAHSVIQQTMITFVVGMILGLIAVTTRSIIPCILYHATHNGLSVILSRTRTATVEASPILKQLLYSSDGTSYQYSLLTGILLSLIGVALIVWFLKLETNKEPSPPDGLLDLSLAVPKKSAT